MIVLDYIDTILGAYSLRIFKATADEVSLTWYDTYLGRWRVIMVNKATSNINRWKYEVMVRRGGERVCDHCLQHVMEVDKVPPCPPAWHH